MLDTLADERALLHKILIFIGSPGWNRNGQERLPWNSSALRGLTHIKAPHAAAVSNQGVMANDARSPSPRSRCGRSIGVTVCVRLIATVALTAVLSISIVESAIPNRCHARLLLKLTPDVPNPRDPVFLNALAGALYELIWVKGNDTVVTLDLTGPPSDYHCENEIERLSLDGHILDLKVLKSDTEQDSSSSL
jgi:hypothetical protein